PRRSPTRSLSSDAVQGLVRAQEELSIAHGGTAVELTRIAQLVVSNFLHLGIRFQDEDSTGATYPVELVLDDDERGVEAAAKPLALDLVAGLCIDAVGRALLIRPVEM